MGDALDVEVGRRDERAGGEQDGGSVASGGQDARRPGPCLDDRHASRPESWIGGRDARPTVGIGAAVAPASVGDPFTVMVEAGLRDESLPRSLAAALLTDAARFPLLPLLDAAGRIRRHYFGNRVQVHQLHNVQNGACPEDCGYCGQSKDSDAPIQPYKLKSREEIVAEAAAAKANGAYRYCMVLSGRGPSEREIDHMAGCIAEIKERFGLRTCLSAGLLDAAKARRLKDAGLDRLNHNLNTSENHYGEICTTHTFADRMGTLLAAKEVGLDLCSGLIVGMGERYDDVIDVAYRLRELRVPSIPVNFLVPIPGNRVKDATLEGRPLTPEIVLRVLCLMRLVNPSAEVRVGAGREGHLRSMQAYALYPANSLFMDGYLLTKGSNAFETLRMIFDASFEPAFDGEWPEELRALVAAARSGGAAAFDVDHSGQVIKADKLKAPKRGGAVALSIHGAPVASA